MPIDDCAFLHSLVQDIAEHGVLRLAQIVRQALPTSYGSARRHKTKAAFLT